MPRAAPAAPAAPEAGRVPLLPARAVPPARGVLAVEGSAGLSVASPAPGEQRSLARPAEPAPGEQEEGSSWARPFSWPPPKIPSPSAPGTVSSPPPAAADPATLPWKVQWKCATVPPRLWLRCSNHRRCCPNLWCPTRDLPAMRFHWCHWGRWGRWWLLVPPGRLGLGPLAPPGRLGPLLPRWSRWRHWRHWGCGHLGHCVDRAAHCDCAPAVAGLL